MKVLLICRFASLLKCTVCQEEEKRTAPNSAPASKKKRREEKCEFVALTFQAHTMDSWASRKCVRIKLFMMDDIADDDKEMAGSTDRIYRWLE